MNKNISIVLFVVSLGLAASIYQYVETFRSEIVSAYDTGKPAVGHSWSEMMCTAGLCIKDDKVGIGTDNPQNTLELGSGATLKISAGAGAGKVLTSDANGVATWGSASSGSGTENYLSKWATSSSLGDSVIYDNGTNVGVGTSAPSKKLEVSGDILSTGDVCNGNGKCLSATYQTNVMIGSNPTCPSGQTMIMKAYNGTWYTYDNASISSWNKVTCGALLSADGTVLLVNNTHTGKNCTDASGTVLSDGTNSFCRFDSSSCPSGWTMYNGWSTTGPATVCCQATYITCVATFCCNAGGHSWSNDGAVETCSAGGTINCSGHGAGARGCTAGTSRIQVGCY